VRLLSNLQDGNKPLVQIMLVGQSELKTKISNPAMASFAQRIGVSYHLEALTHQETHEYIQHRLQTVGGRTDLFTPAAIDQIFETADGTPRAINLLCDHSLVYGFVDELESIDKEVVKQVAEEFGTYLAPQASSKANQPQADGTQPSTGSLHIPEQLETRLTSIERLVGGYIKELHGLLKSQLNNERKRSDKLLMEYTLLKSKLDTLEDQKSLPDIKAKNRSKRPSQESQKTNKNSPQASRMLSRLKAINTK
jgi:general secretion pathway protein A